MKSVTPNPTWMGWLGRWSWRGALWAAPSAFFAWGSGYQNAPAIGGMVCGVAVWCFVYASICSNPHYNGEWRRTRIARRLRIVGRVKTLLMVVWLLALIGQFRGIWQWVGIVCAGDFYGGIWATGLTKLMGGVAADLDPRREIWTPEFGWTLLTTLIQGAVVSVQVVLVAVVAWLFPPYRTHKPVVRDAGANSAGENESL